MISIILPTVRPRLLRHCLDAIIRACGDVPFEVIIVADFNISAVEEPGAKNLFLSLPPFLFQWITQTPRQGVVAALNAGMEKAKGDYIFTLSDEAILYDKSLEILFKIAEAGREAGKMFLLSPSNVPEYGFFYYGKQFAPFPFAHKDLLKELGGLFDPAYKCFYADPDLSLRAHEKGVAVLYIEDAKIFHPNDMNCPAHKFNVSEYVEADRKVFKERWAHLGEFKDP